MAAPSPTALLVPSAQMRSARESAGPNPSLGLQLSHSEARDPRLGLDKYDTLDSEARILALCGFMT